MHQRIGYSILAYICFSASVCAQDLALQLRNFSERLEHAQSVYFRSNIVVDYINEAPMQQDIVYERTPEGSYYKTTNMEMIADKEIALMIYSEDKKVLVQRNEKGQHSKESAEANIMLSDTLLRKNDSIVYKGIIDHAHVYTIYSSKKYIKEAEFAFNVSDGLLKRAVYIYNTSFKLGVEKTTLTFVNFSINGPATIKKTSSSVLTYANNKYTLTPAYARYQLINLDSKY